MFSVKKMEKLVSYLTNLSILLGAQATRLIGNVHQSWLVGTDELYSEREAL